MVQPQLPEAPSNGQQEADAFTKKTEAGSADLYFGYYAQLAQQANMLQDYVRTGTYYSAILENAVDFKGMVVMDVGAGSGILSLFAAQAGAAKVYAVEASGMATFARQLMAANPGVGAVVEVIQSRLEQLQLPLKVDVLVSEPMGTLLVNERMLETYLYARDNFLKPGGKMFPQLGRIHVAAFSDASLHQELVAKAAFWLQPQFYGVDITCLHAPAARSFFEEVVIDAIDPSVLVSDCATQTYNFGSVTDAELMDITIPLQLHVGEACEVHGVACWFDVLFDGSTQQRWLTTAPGQPTTHWFQLRCVLQQPIRAAHSSVLSGQLHLVAHNQQSYDIHLTLASSAPAQPGKLGKPETGKYSLKSPYYRQLNQYPQPQFPAQPDEQQAAYGQQQAYAQQQPQQVHEQQWYGVPFPHQAQVANVW